MLPTWLDANAAALAGTAPPALTLDGALPGYTRAQSLTPMQRLQRVQASGLAECGGAGEPIYLAWRSFLRGLGSATLVIDATSYDERALAAGAVLDRASWLLAEGVIIALGLRDSQRIELRLPAELTGHEAAFLNTVDAIRALAQIAAPDRELEVVRNSQPSCWAAGQASEGSHLIHTPETWCRIALLFAGASDLDKSLLTLRRGMKQRGLVELDRSGNLRGQIDGWGGGVEVQGEDAVLVFDDGLGGFLPLSAADLSCQPLALADAGIMPAPATLMVLAEGVCMVKQTRRALYRHWKLAEGEASAGAQLAGARCAADDRDHPRPRRRRPSGRPGRCGAATGGAGAGGRLAIDQLAALLPRAVGKPRAARVLPGGCVSRSAASYRPVPPNLPGQHRHPQLHRPPGARRLPRHDRGDPARQSPAADLRPGLPGAVRIGLRARRQQRGCLHPAAEGRGRRTLPGRRRLPAA